MQNMIKFEYQNHSNLLCDYSDFDEMTINPSFKILLWIAQENKAVFPYEDIIRVYHKTGKHFVPDHFLELLNVARKKCATFNTDDAENALRFLKVVLDKYDGSYDYRSYLALDLLDMPNDHTETKAYTEAQSYINHMTLLLTADLLKFELGGLEPKRNLRFQLPEQALVEKRCARALKAVSPYVQRMGLIYRKTDNCIESVKNFIVATQSKKRPNDEQMLVKTNLPVYLIHDEYMFIRILQMFEYSFSWIVIGLRAAIESLSKTPNQTSMIIKSCEQKIKEVTGFFYVLSTMRAESFKVFREYTEGASAIQSRNYKRIESLCRQPDQERLHSIAYRSVPEVQKKLLISSDNLDLALRQAQHSGRLDCKDFIEVKQAMKSFSTTMKRWKQTHYGLAMKMLGEGSGTGYTEGTPYLAFAKDIPVFDTSLDV
ncbi:MULTISPECIES: tryptophan 2,3-dioxygenase family protein [Cysteiniphilum]|uniref:tryptophan 2,3-dioxygenase family protein n=1 Tax=Cysteiniphilum TaxID=2056696 RepID=UPI00177D8890|nr:MULTISPECIES: tryptophan 2,3-dioxygenase family protein [Cysteiniphilum]